MDMMMILKGIHNRICIIVYLGLKASFFTSVYLHEGNSNTRSKESWALTFIIMKMYSWNKHVSWRLAFISLVGENTIFVFIVCEVEFHIHAGTFVLETWANITIHLIKQVQMIHQLVIRIASAALKLQGLKKGVKLSVTWLKNRIIIWSISSPCSTSFNNPNLIHLNINVECYGLLDNFTIKQLKQLSQLQSMKLSTSMVTSPNSIWDTHLKCSNGIKYFLYDNTLKCWIRNRWFIGNENLVFQNLYSKDLTLFFQHYRFIYAKGHAQLIQLISDL